jgi:hypothetical protein
VDSCERVFIVADYTEAGYYSTGINAEYGHEVIMYYIIKIETTLY